MRNRFRKFLVEKFDKLIFRLEVFAYELEQYIEFRNSRYGKKENG